MKAKTITIYPNAAEILADGSIALGTHVGYKSATWQEIDPYDALGAFAGGALTRNQSLGNQVRINVGIATVTGLSKDPSGNSLGGDYWGAVTSPVINAPFSKTPLGNALGGYLGEYIGDLNNREKDYNKIKNNFDGIMPNEKK